MLWGRGYYGIGIAGQISRPLGRGFALDEGLRSVLDKLKVALTDPRRAARSIHHRLAHYLGRRDYRKYIILSQARSGSNMLASILFRHSTVQSENELFENLNGRSVEEILAGVFRRYPRSIRAVGFKIFYYHPQDDQSGHVWDVLRAMDDLVVIHLRRENILRSRLSLKIAEATKLWGQNKDERSVPPLEERQRHLDKNELLAAFVQTRRWEREFDAMFADHPVVHVTYEQLTADPERHTQRICDALGVTMETPETLMKRQNPEPLSSLIVNYDELKAAFAGTEWAEYFDD